MKQNLFKTMLVTLLTMLVAMNASAQTQNYYSEGFENWANGNASRNGWTIDQSSYVQRGTGHAHTGTYALQIGSGTGSSPSNIVTPFLGKSGSIPSSAVMTLWFCMDNLDATITLSAEGGATISSITPSNTNKVTCSLDNGTAVVTATEKKYYMLTINLTGCNTNTKLRIKTTHRTYIDDLLVTGDADQRTPVTLEYSADKYTTPTEEGEIKGAPMLTVTPAEAASEVVFSSSDEDVAYFDEDGKLIAVAPGTTTITASISGSETYRDAETSYTLKVGLASSNLSYNPTSVTVTYGGNFTMPDLSYAQGYDKNLITYTSSNEKVATVDASSGEVTILAVGETTITASGADTPYLKASKASFTLTVDDIQGSATGGGTGGTLFKETFNKTTGSGGWNGSAGNGDLNTSGDKQNTDENDWTVTKGFGGYKYAKFGNSSTKGSAMTRYIDVEIGKTYTLTFKAAPWDEEKTPIKVTVTNGCEIKGISSDNMTPKQWNNYTATLTPQTVERIRIKFEAASKERFFLDEINVVAPATDETVEVTIPASGWGTYCCQWPLDFTAAPEGLKAYAVTNVSGNKATLTQVTGSVKGGVPLLLNGAPGEYSLTVAEYSTNEVAGNLLKGTLSPTYVERETSEAINYGLKSGEFHAVISGTMPAGKAYLPITKSAAAAGSKFVLVFEDTTGISQYQSVQSAAVYYDLQGRRVDSPRKGVYVRNGKKVVIK